MNPTIGTIGVTETEAAQTVDVPTALLAETVNVSAVPLDNPVTVPVVANQETPAVFPPGEEVIVYLVIAEPPSLTGAVQDTNPAASSAVAVTPVGAPGTALGVTTALAVDAANVPAALVADTVNV